MQICIIEYAKHESDVRIRIRNTFTIEIRILTIFGSMRVQLPTSHPPFPPLLGLEPNLRLSGYTSTVSQGSWNGVRLWNEMDQRSMFQVDFDSGCWRAWGFALMALCTRLRLTWAQMGAKHSPHSIPYSNRDSNTSSDVRFRFSVSNYGNLPFENDWHRIFRCMHGTEKRQNDNFILNSF